MDEMDGMDGMDDQAKIERLEAEVSQLRLVSQRRLADIGKLGEVIKDRDGLVAMLEKHIVSTSEEIIRKDKVNKDLRHLLEAYENSGLVNVAANAVNAYILLGNPTATGPEAIAKAAVEHGKAFVEAMKAYY